MRNLLKIIVLLFTTILFSFQDTTSICSAVKNKKFTYKNGEKTVFVSFKNNLHTELHNNKKHFIKSTIQWLSNCEYYLIITKTNLPDFPFKIGSKLHVTILKTKGKNVYYKSSLNGRDWEGKLTLLNK